MLAKESAGLNLDLPEEVLEVLPSDPFEQLDVARKITSIALSTRISYLESEASVLRQKLTEKDNIIADLQSQIESLDVSLNAAADKLAQADTQKESLLKENASLTSAVKKLSRDVAKLESFRKTLMQSLQEDEEHSAEVARFGAPHISPHDSLSSQSLAGDDDATVPHGRTSSMQSQSSEVGNSYARDFEADASSPRISQGLLLASQTSTPRFTPPGSPPSLSASVSPTRTSKPVSPRRHSISFATTRAMFDDRSSVFSSMHSSQRSSMSGLDTGSQFGRTRVDGKEFFRQVRNRLSYEQFSTFLANVKELNSHKQTREETLRKAEEIFGPDNKDLYAVFEGLITPSKSLDAEKDDGGSSPRGVLEEENRELETASSKESTSDSVPSAASTSAFDCQTNPKSGSQWQDFVRKIKKAPAVGLHSLQPSMPSLPSIRKLTRKKSRNAARSLPALPPNLDAEVYCFESSLKNYSLSELQTATDNFSSDYLIGEGGYSQVYKGHLEDGQLVAIKRLTRGTPEEMTADFLSELGILVHVDHPNIAHAIGYGVEGGMHLVLPLSPFGSLASLLNGEKEKLAWSIRYNIASGTASGLTYLHEDCQRRIIHRDIKAANILLTENFEPQISDFGLAKWLPGKWTHLNVSQYEGTFGYLPPEFFLHGMVDEKTDVYAYGVLLLELITGRPALDSSQKSLLMWAKPLISKGCIEELADPSLGGSYDLEQISRLVSIASMCVDPSSSERPSMSQVVCMLTSDEDMLGPKKKFQRRPSFKRSCLVEVSDEEEEYDTAKYLVCEQH